MLYQKENSGICEHHDIRHYQNFDYIPHIHTDLELVWLLAGQLEVRVGGRAEQMAAGEAALIWPNQVHAYRSLGPNEAIIHVFSPDTVESFLREAGERVGERAIFRCADWVHAFCLRVVSGEGTLSPLLLRACLEAACSEYLRQVPLVEQERQSDHLFVQILNYVDGHFREDITLASTAVALGYEPHYLSRYFGGIAKTNFRQFVNGRRIEAARRLMHDRSIPITEVAMRSGFQSIRNFNRVFLEMVGVSPSEYRAAGAAQLPSGTGIFLTKSGQELSFAE